MRVAFVNPISQTSPDRWNVPPVQSNRQSISVQLAREVSALGHDVRVYMAGPFLPARRDEGVAVEYLPVRRTPLSPSAQLPFIPSLSSRVASGSYDVVICSEIFQWSTLQLAMRRDVPPLLVWHEADAYQRFGGGWPARTYYRTAGRRIVSSAVGFMPRTDSAEAFLRRVGVPETRIGPQVPNGIDDVLFTPERGRREASPLILFVGSLIERKNPQLAVRAMEWVLKEVPDARLLLKGFGDQEPPLRDLAVRLGISSAVEFDTERSTHEEMADVYNRAWVAVFPSFRDFASLSPLEAVGCGVPTVMATRLHCAKYLTAMGCGKGAGDEPEEFAGCITALLREHGRPGLMEDRIAPVRERYSLRSAAQKLCAYAEQVIA